MILFSPVWNNRRSKNRRNYNYRGTMRSITTGQFPVESPLVLYYDSGVLPFSLGLAGASCDVGDEGKYFLILFIGLHT